MLQATYSRKYVEAVDRLFDEFRQRTAAIAESVGMKIYYLVPLHPLEREKPRFTHRLAYRATEVASLDSSQLQLFSEGWCRAGVFAPNGHHRSGPRPRCSICRWIWRLVCGSRMRSALLAIAAEETPGTSRGRANVSTAASLTGAIVPMCLEHRPISATHSNSPRSEHLRTL